MQSEDYGVLQRMIDQLYADKPRPSRLDIIIFAQTYDLPRDLMEIVELLPPGNWTRGRLCDQFNSAISGHGWGFVYGTVE
jgi:hypothetical protein